MRTEWVTRLRAPREADPYSGEADAADWDNAIAKRIHTKGAVEPLDSSEPLLAGREAVTSGYRLYLDPCADVLTTDRFNVRGAVHRVEGEPALWQGSCLVVIVTKIVG